MEERERRQLIEQYIAAYNRGDVDGMSALLTPDVLFEKYMGRPHQRIGARCSRVPRTGAPRRHAFLDRAQSVVALKFGPSSAVATIEYRGVLAMDMPEGPKAESVIELSGE